MIVIIDYGMGNLYSIQSALSFLGAESVISADHEVIRDADRLILPGVGSFRQAMENLERSGTAAVIKDVVLQGGTPILGICLGMQLLGASSTEDGFTRGLRLIDTPVERFQVPPPFKVPHVGFSPVRGAGRLFHGLEGEVDFYFTHSYRMAAAPDATAATCTHGEEFVAAVEKGAVCGTQFHPEKSQTNGLTLLKNFVERF